MRVLLAALVVTIMWMLGAALWRAAPWRSAESWAPDNYNASTDRLAASAAPAALPDGRYTRLVDLAGAWQIRLGDDPAWAAPVAAADSALWQSVVVPGAWEDAGFWNYDGFAWLRRTFTLPPETGGRSLVLRLGRVDDADEVYLNGQRIGSTGVMPPHYETAYYASRAYFLPADALRQGPNTLAVRIYDGELSGGIAEGPVEIAVADAGTTPGTPLIVDLAGRWRATDRDRPEQSAPGTDDAAWAEITVPERWESQGYPDLDGVVWMRRAVALTPEQAAQPLVFVVGAVDDLDETFVNGTRIGGTGRIGPAPVRDPAVVGDEWQRPRAYPVPPGVLHAGRNVVAVRVYDGLIDGGIVKGPVGLATPEAVRSFVRAARAQAAALRAAP